MRVLFSDGIQVETCPIGSVSKMLIRRRAFFELSQQANGELQVR